MASGIHRRFGLIQICCSLKIPTWPYSLLFSPLPPPPTSLSPTFLSTNVWRLTSYILLSHSIHLHQLPLRRFQSAGELKPLRNTISIAQYIPQKERKQKLYIPSNSPSQLLTPTMSPFPHKTLIIANTTKPDPHAQIQTQHLPQFANRSLDPAAVASHT